jgi:hypothetical protein
MMTTAEAIPEAVDVQQDVVTCPFCGVALTPERPFCTACGQPNTPLPVAAVVRGRYLIAELLASSEAGHVYAAHDQKRKRDIALKELLPPAGLSAGERGVVEARFLQEAKRLARLKHARIVEIRESFVFEGRYYLVMPLLPGKDFQSRLAERRYGYPEGQVRDWAFRLLGVLESLQSQRPPAVHGEVLPSHVMLKADGTPCLLPPSLAARLRLRPYITLPGQLVAALTDGSGGAGSGTTYVPGPRDDVYMLGATLHSLLTNRDVQAGASDSTYAFPPVRFLAPRVSVGTAEVIGQAVSPDPQRRFASAGAMRALLNSATAGKSYVAPVATEQRARRSLHLPVAALVVLVLAIIAGLAYYAHTTATPTAPDAAIVAGDINPLVSGAPPAVAHTAGVSDAFIGLAKQWPSSGKVAYQQGSALWLNNSGGVPVKVTRAGYATGRDGYRVSATLRLVRGATTVPYGVIASDQAGTVWNNVALLVKGNGDWALGQYTGGILTLLVPWRHASAVRVGHNIPNELQLAFTPGASGGSGVFTATINGVQVGAGSLTTGGVDGGRVGLVSDPGAQVVCDLFSVAAPGTPQATLEEHFLTNARHWSTSSSAGVASLVTGGLLRLQVGAGQTVAQIGARGFGPGAAGNYGIDAELQVRSSGPTPGAGGIVFATGAPGSGRASLAAVVTSDGQISMVALQHGKSKTLTGPVASAHVRTGYGLNLLRVDVQHTGDAIQAVVKVNGGEVMRYSAGASGLQPVTRLVAVGDGSTVVAGAVRVYR